MLYLVVLLKFDQAVGIVLKYKKDVNLTWRHSVFMI
jgi:hypothetical protein